MFTGRRKLQKENYEKLQHKQALHNLFSIALMHSWNEPRGTHGIALMHPWNEQP